MPDAIIGQIDEKLFICGVDALYNVADDGSGKKVWMAADRLKELNITHIMNIAEEHIYSPGPGDNAEPANPPLVEQLQSLVKMRIFGTEDVDTQDMSQHFEEMAKFIKEGREAGGVVVHCRQGHSRAATCALSYLVLGTHLSLNAAFEKIHRVRSQIKPNAGFWRQLRELEASLLKQGIDLAENPDDLVSEKERAAARRVIRDLDQRDLGQRYLALSKTTVCGNIGPGADRNDSREKLQEIAHRVGRLLKARGETVAVSESSCGNLISEVLSTVPGASLFYKGANAAGDEAANDSTPKEEFLATQARKQLDATWGLSAIDLLLQDSMKQAGAGGLAAVPTGANPSAGKGQAVLAIAGEPEKRTRKLKTEIQDAEQNMLIYCCSALDLFEQALQEASPSGGAAKSKL